MRLFGSDWVAKMMDRMGLEEGEVIQHSMMTKSIERAQKKVEENHFGIRKRLLEYDDVMNRQREIIYGIRRDALEGKDMKEFLFEACMDAINDEFDIFYKQVLNIGPVYFSTSEGVKSR